MRGLLSHSFKQENTEFWNLIKKSQENIKLSREEAHIRTLQAENELCICTACIRADFTPFGIINIYIQLRRQSYRLDVNNQVPGYYDMGVLKEERLPLQGGIKMSKYFWSMSWVKHVLSLEDSQKQEAEELVRSGKGGEERGNFNRGFRPAGPQVESNQHLRWVWSYLSVWTASLPGGLWRCASLSRPGTRACCSPRRLKQMEKSPSAIDGASRSLAKRWSSWCCFLIRRRKILEFEMDSNESYFLLLDENLPTLRVDGRDTPLSPTQWLFKVTSYFPSSLSKFVLIRFTIYTLVTRSRVGWTWNNASYYTGRS